MTGTPNGDREDAVKAVESAFAELMTQVRRIITTNAARVSPGMLPGAYKVFTMIADKGPLTSRVIAERLYIDKGQLSRTVKELEDLGLIARTADPSDGRSHLLEVTAEGRRRLEQARAPQEHGLAAALEHWEIDDVRRLADLLHALANEETPQRD